MKTALIFFRNKDEKINPEYLQKITDVITDGGFGIDSLEIFSDKDDIGFTRCIDRYADTVDNLIILDSGNTSFAVKEIIAEKTDSILAENENAARFLDAVSKADGVAYPAEYARIPLDATLIPNINGAYQGYMLDDKEFTLIVLPDGFAEYKVMCENYVLPYLEKKFGVTHRKDTLKFFGGKKKLVSVLDELAARSSNNFRYTLKEENGDFTVNTVFEGKAIDDYDEYMRILFERLGDGIYADYDVGLSQRLFDALKLRDMKISFAESFTAGRLAASVISNSGASAYVSEGIVAYSNESKVYRLGVSEADLKRHGAVSSVVAYQMAAGLLNRGTCDLAVSTTGIAGPKSDDTEKPVGLAFIGIGTKEGVYTYRLNLSGNRETITETAKNTALFLALKKIKSI